jgi:hypothetical protein
MMRQAIAAEQRSVATEGFDDVGAILFKWHPSINLASPPHAVRAAAATNSCQAARICFIDNFLGWGLV